MASLRVRTHLTGPLGAPSVFYELRERHGAWDVVRLAGESCQLVDVAGTIDTAAALIADDLHPFVAEHQERFLLTHAGAVEWCGVGIVIPGRSRSGKSSLTAALISAGATYLSDEIAPIDRDGLVHPYPRHLSMRGADGESEPTPPSRFAAAVADAPCPVRFIIDTHYVEGADFVPERLTGAAALLRLINNTIVARSRPCLTMQFVAGLVESAEVLHSPQGEAAAAAETILGLVGAMSHIDSSTRR